MKKRCVIFLCSALMMLSCGEEKKKPVFYDSDLETETESYQGEEASDDYQELSDAEIISVPFTEKGGVKFVNVSVNGFGFQMIFDTGCSSTLISVAEANYLYQRGYLTENDIVGVTQSQIADGSIVENMVVNLKEVIIDNQINAPMSWPPYPPITTLHYYLATKYWTVSLPMPWTTKTKPSISS